MSTDENKAIARRAFDFWNTRDESAIDQLIAPDYVLHLGGRPDVAGIDAYRRFYAMYAAAFPDQQWTMEDAIAEGDKVSVRWTLRAIHQGELMGIPATGKAVTVTGISITRIADGKLAEGWVQSDILGLLQQLGAIPVPGQGTG